jgi:hypothetical protein
MIHTSIGAIAGVALAYSVFVIFTLEPNPALWTEGDRIIAVMLAAIFGLLGGVFAISK